jgi:hypothetical protein
MNPNRGGLPPISQGTKDTKVGGGTGGGFEVGTKMGPESNVKTLNIWGWPFFLPSGKHTKSY